MKISVNCPDKPTDERFVDLQGQRINRLSVIGYAGKRGQNQKWLCQCDCGNLIVVRADHLTTQKTESCGCFHKEHIVKTNSARNKFKTHHVLYNRWLLMRQRCNNPKNPNYSDYGGRGIKICERWNSFENFIADMGEPPTPEHTLDRKDVNGDYSPENCRWSDQIAQANNKTNSLFYTINGETRSLAEWCRIYNAPYARVRDRLIKHNKNGQWDIYSALTTPPIKSADRRKLKRKLSYKVGDRLSNWTVIALAPTIDSKGTRWLCRCACGTTKTLYQSSMKRGETKSCGCLRSKLTGDRNRKHGKSKLRVYGIWRAMINRCNNPKATGYERYGGRGIKVCDRWLELENFLADMGEPPSPQHSLDRINNDGNYEPENCQWKTIKEQNRNKKSNHLITIDGETKLLIEWLSLIHI